MKFKAREKRNSGFTLVEMLAVTAIVVILLAIGMVAVVHYVRWLRITELDNSAREIYLAAENRAVLLSAGGRLDKLVTEANGKTMALPAEERGATPLAAGGAAQQSAQARYIYYDSAAGGGEDVLAELLPQGTIDPALRGGCFYVVYEIKTDEDGTQSGLGSVTDVFYAEESDPWKNEGFETFYQQWKGSSRQRRLDEKKMFGYYGGAAAENGGANSLKAPLLEVINGEELIVRLTYSRPAGEARTAEVTLYYDGCRVRLDELPRGKWWTEETKQDVFQNTVTHTCTWVLDTLKENGPRFRDLFDANLDAVTGNPGPMGGDFTVTARIRSTTVASPDVVSAPRNSLFADGSGGETAYVENLRHLQNLDHNFSKVEGKTAAIQTGDIDCGASVFTGYEFVPIENAQLTSYCGSHAASEGAEAAAHFIKGMKVTAASANGRNGGLFSTVPSGMEFRDVCLLNTSVKMGAGVSTGALAGVATGTTFTNCWVYWEGEELEELKASIPESGLADNHYQITGSSAGGLVGQLNGGTITDCLAATLVKGTTVAGGLVGQTTGVTVSTSYADCYLVAPTAGGLIGTAGGTVTLTNVYAAGFIDNTVEDAVAAGLCNGNATANHAYSAMHYESTEGAIVPLATGVTAGDGSRCYYLGVDKDGKPYEDMIEQEFLTKIGADFGWKYSDSHPYSLLKDLTTYPFPGLKELPHYGDWNAEFVKPALAYFEKYKPLGDGTEQYGFYADSVDTLKKDTEVEGNWTVPLDGYAVAFRAEDANGNVSVTFTYYDEHGTEQTCDQAYHKNEGGIHDKLWEVEHKGETYYLAILPQEVIVGSDYASENFYQRLGISVKNGPITWAAYCPHFAKTARPISEETTDRELANMAKQARHSVRTPRHLRALSGHGEYYHAAGGQGYSFSQELDLDYTTYEGEIFKGENLAHYSWIDGDGSTKSEKRIQAPIGRSGASFNGVYHGGCHTIAGVKFQTAGVQYAGLFGLSVGTLQDIVYLMDPEQPVAAERGGGSLYLGGLAGGNSGTIRNCAVAGAKLEIAIHNKGAAYVGGLVGLNEGTIRSCAAEVAGLNASGDDYSNVYTGGLVGRNAGAGGSGIFASYAVGWISGKVVEGSMVRVCGFVGYNTGYIEGSYAAARLESSGTGAEVYGFCGERLGTQRDNYFVDRGNFTYRGEPYNGTYATGAETAAPVSYQLMCGGEPAEGETRPKLAGMIQGGRAVNGNPPKKGEETSPRFPLPTGVKDRHGAAVHYGQWPEELDLGNMGVYYWEKLELPAASGADKTRQVYGVSMLKVDPDKSTVEKISTLSNARSDGGVVTDYGYGWYYETQEEAGNTVETEFDAKGLYYTEDGGQVAPWTDQKSDKAVDEKLAELMPGYEFQSYHSFVPNPNPNVNGNTGARAGLYAIGVKDEHGKEQTPNGTVTLKEENVKVTFEVNPHFADALAVQTDMLPDKWKEPEGEIAVSPGTKESNPYEVRAMGQLSAINWNSTNRNTKTVIDGESNNTQFPYLSYSGKTQAYTWLQTHDLNGWGGTYTPIAEYYDRSNANEDAELKGWFGGTFDGDDYVIENVNIQGQESSCAGLFGIVYNGTLRSVILHSSNGEETISGFGGATGSVWYAMGGLAGLAASSKAEGAVENCAVSGYTVRASFQLKEADRSWGGANVGGLLGVSNMALKNCSAVTDIKIESCSPGNDNMRVGGLVGVSQNKFDTDRDDNYNMSRTDCAVQNCYAGGSIALGNNVTVKDKKGIYIGGIVGGSYVKPLSIDGYVVGITGFGNNERNETNNTLINCYSYVTLPKQDAHARLLGLFAVGGTGEINPKQDDGVANHGVCTIQNCYYLKSEVMKNNLDGIYTVNSHQLKTDLDLTRDSVQMIARDEKGNIKRNTNNSFVEQRLSLTSDDVGKKFLVSYSDNGNSGWTYYRSVMFGDKTCLYRDDAASSCMPIFTIEGVGPTGDSRWVTFMGWATGIANGKVGGVIADPTKLAVSAWNNLMAVTYNQLKVSNGTGAVLSRLGAFDPVTDTEGSFAIPGKYSYNAAARLQGLNYPFPTILTREGGSIHVHYGDWPLNGIERANGGAPIRLDLMQENKDTEKEKLTLSAGVPSGGTWTLVEEEGETPVMKAYWGDDENSKTFHDTSGSCELTVKGLKPGQTEVTVVYKQGVEEYRMPITVQVTAPLRVKTEVSPIYVFPGAQIRAPLVLCDDEGKELGPEKLKDVEINLGKSQCKWPEELLEGATLHQDPDEGYYYLELTVVDDPEKIGQEPEALPVSVSYTYQGTEIEAEISTLSVQMKPLPKPETVTVEGEDVTQITFEAISLDEKDEAGVTVTAETTVKEVRIDSVKEPEPADPDNPATDPDAATDPAEKPEAKAEGNAVLLKNYDPDTEVTLTLTLELRRSDAGADERPITQIVPMTVTIPKTDPVTPEGDGTGTDQTEKQNTAGNAAPEPEASQEAKLPEGAEKKTDPVPEEEAGAGEDGTAPEQ